MDKQKKEKWANKDLWSESEFQALCCGLEPDTGRRDTPELNEAIEAIRRAAYVKVIPSIDPSDMTDGDKLYYRARFFVPCHVIAWANKHFPEFPFNPEDFSDLAIGKPDLGERERETLLKMIGALAMLVANKGGKYKKKDDPNALQISEDVTSLFEETDKFDKHGLSSRNLREKISEGINFLTK
jgi:hypothetical protein